MRRKRLPVVLVSGALVVFTLLFGLEIAADANGHSIDPTDPMNYNTYVLRNDSTTALYIHLCADTNCATLDRHSDWATFKPGEADDDQVYWGSSTPTVYAVALTPSFAGRRCLVLNAAKKAAAKVDAPLSSAGACGG